jgi:iron complex outermembrane receptor protein
VAAGGELREEKFTFNPSQSFQIGDVAGFGGNILDVDKKRNVASVYSEVAVPIFRSFEADAGIRFDHYETVGNTTNPKISFRWNPTTEFLMRGSYGSGFRAPSLTDLYTPQAASVTANGTRDPIRCPSVTTGAPADCNNQFPTITGGNPNLKPEKSRSGTLGIVYEPNRAMSFGVDAFWITIKDQIVIGGLATTVILANVANATQFASFIVRGAPDSNPSGVGPIIGIIQTTSNLFKVKATGYDVNFAVRPDIGAGQKLALRLDGTYIWRSLRQNFDGSYTSNADNAINAAGGVIPIWRHVASAQFDRGPWMLAVQQNFQNSYNDQNNNIAPVVPRQVGAYETFDAQARYSGFRNLQLSLGVKNFTDHNPPYTNAGGQFIAGYDVTYADVRGRFVYGTVKYTFK